jgi:hypothetical protein
MTTFNLWKQQCPQRFRKNKNAGTVDFNSQIASSICTVMFTKCIKPDATIFKSRCSRTAVSYRFMAGQALLLNFVRFFRLANSSPMIQRSPARWSRNVREPFDKTSGKMSRISSTELPDNGRAVANALTPNVRTATCETTRNVARNGHAMSAPQSAQQAMQHPAKHLARRLVGVLSSRFQP